MNFGYFLYIPFFFDDDVYTLDSELWYLVDTKISYLYAIIRVIKSIIYCSRSYKFLSERDKLQQYNNVGPQDFLIGILWLRNINWILLNYEDLVYNII